MKAPFVYFGGKTSVAPVVWQALGQPGHYIEPFAGSCAVLLNRPGWNLSEVWDASKFSETINDADCYVENAWRGIKLYPDETAKWCDWPVNHAALMARKARLIREKNYLLENCVRDDKWFDAELAGYWIWAASCWIGSGLTRPSSIPNLANVGKGVHAKGQIPRLSNAGTGVHAKGQRPHLTGTGRGGRNQNIYDWFDQLSERLRYVRVVCGDWSRVCGGDWQDGVSGGNVGFFFDPPYAVEDRRNVYDVDSFDVAHKVRQWCIERGGRESYRIVLAGYDEHTELKDHGWTSQAWKTGGGYGNMARTDEETQGQKNCHREVLWFSPFTLHKIGGLFDVE